MHRGTTARHLLSFFACSLFACGLIACGDETGAVDAQTSDAGTDAVVIPAAFGDVHAILAARCAVPGCHVGASSPGGLDMSTSALAHMNLVSTEAAGPSCGGMGTRVTPGDPEASVFYSKIADADPLCGARMPLGGRALSADEIDLVRRWILSGAQP